MLGQPVNDDGEVMSMADSKQWTEQPGQPDISFSGFQLWIHGQERGDTREYWEDGNWLSVTAHCGASGADVWAQGSILQLADLVRWLKQLEDMSRTMSGRAELAPVEPNLHIKFEMGKLGHIAMQINITPEYMSQDHEFREEIDQSYLPALIRQIRTVLQKYPIQGTR
jgi:hypothetical protein